MHEKMSKVSIISAIVLFIKKEILFLNTLFYSIALLGNSRRIQRDTAYKNRIDEQWKKVVNRHTSIMFT